MGGGLHWPVQALQGLRTDYTCLVTYLIEVDHDIAFRPSAALDVLQGQGEVDAPGVRDVEVVGVVLVPFLDGCEHLVLISADNVHVLGQDRKEEGTVVAIKLECGA